MQIAITQVLIKEQVRHSFVIDCSQMPKSLARNLALVVDRAKFFDLPRVLRCQSKYQRDTRLKLSIEEGDKRHTVHGEYFAFPQQLHYLVWQSFDFFLRTSQGDVKVEAEAFKRLDHAHNHQAIVDAYTKVYGRWSPTLYFNPHLAPRFATMVAQWVSHEHYLDDRPEYKAQANAAAHVLYADLVEEDRLFNEVAKELAIALGQVTPEDLSTEEFKEAKARVDAHREYLRMEYPDGMT